MRPKTRFVRGDGGVVAYQVVGEGPDLVLVPSWLSNLDVMWDDPSFARFLERLASFSRLICLDLRGTGVSDAVPYTALPTLEEWMDDILVVMAAVDSQQAALLSYDAGGLLSMLFAASYPEGTSHLVIVDAYAWLKSDEDHPIGYPEEVLEHFIAFLEDLQATHEEPGFLRLIAPDAYQDPRFREWFGRYMHLATPPSLPAAMARMTFQRDLRPVLGSIRAPSLLMSHQNEAYAGARFGRYVADHIAGARYIDLPSRDVLIFRSDADTIVNETREFVTGRREAPESDRVLATVLFTDIVGSTDRAASVGDRRWRELLDTHDAIVRTHLEQFRGREVKTTGDGVLASFDGPARAIRCASAIASEVRSLGIEIKAGLHTGEVEVRGEDIGGIAVHTAARVMAEAAAGQVLVSRTVKDLVAGSEIEFDDRGEHALKGVPGEWRLFAVRS